MLGCLCLIAVGVAGFVYAKFIAPSADASNDVDNTGLSMTSLTGPYVCVCVSLALALSTAEVFHVVHFPYFVHVCVCVSMCVCWCAGVLVCCAVTTTVSPPLCLLAD